MTKIHVPAGYNTVMTYLIVESAEQLLEFMKTVFNAKEKMVTKDDEGKIRHAEVTIGESCIMFANSTDQFTVQNAGMYIHVADADATYAAALKADAESIMPPSDMDYGRSGGVKDPLGNTWWITTTKE